MAVHAIRVFGISKVSISLPCLPHSFAISTANLLVGRISFLLAIELPELFVMKSFGRIPNKDVSFEVDICFGFKPVLTEYISEVPSSPPSM